jgi:hypothetical protein
MPRLATTLPPRYLVTLAAPARNTLAVKSRPTHALPSLRAQAVQTGCRASRTLSCCVWVRLLSSQVTSVTESVLDGQGNPSNTISEGIGEDGFDLVIDALVANSVS